MKTFTNEDLRKFEPCYDPNKYLDEDKVFTVIDILDHSEIPFEDKLWVILRTDFLSDKLMRLFAVWSYRQTLQWIKDPDPRSIECANMSERFANGEATREQLDAAWSAAESAARSAWSFAWSARSAAESAWSATESAARSAAISAKSAADSATRSAADSATRSAQQIKLREMIIAGIETGDVK